ncbi:MAG: hypothetical protein Q7R47_00695, partial [Candidatus Diapherotrites archaeon]|nr:hypothetical protein [Candidatus Diapherotrites archaeon]
HAEKTILEIRRHKPNFDLMRRQSVESEYDEGGPITYLFPNDRYFAPDSSERFFAHFHTHPLVDQGGRLIERETISARDLENTRTYGPSVVFQFQKDHYAVHVAVNGKVVLSKRFSLTTRPK